MRPLPDLTNCLVALSVCALLAGCHAEDSWDGVTDLTYSERALVESVKRRLRLVSAGVALPAELSTDSIWTNAMRFTFISRTPPDGELGIESVRALKNGVTIKGEVHGIYGMGRQRYGIAEGFHIVDLFSPRDRHIATAVTPTRMSTRRILQHLGVTKRYSDKADRMYMHRDEIVAWRDMLPVVVMNGGYGPLYHRPGGHDAQGNAAADSLFATVYDLEEEEEYVLVGKTRAEEKYRHIFTAGGEYVCSVMLYQNSPLRGKALLRHLGLERDRGRQVPPRSSGAAR